MGAIEQDIIKQAVRCGQPIPERIANAPSLQLGLEVYFQAFFDLDSERSYGFGLGRIPWQAIAVYATFYGFTSDETEDLIRIIRSMDGAYLQYMKEKTDNESK